MISISTARFCKRQTCPPADLLMRYGQASLTLEKCREISAHLESCDFCGAEWQLLLKHPPSAVLPSAPVQMPQHLYRLAVEVLTTIQAGVGSAETIYEKTSLTLTMMTDA